MGNTSLAWFLSSPWTSTPHTCIYCKGLPTFCPFGVHSAQTVVDFAHFQIQGVFWGGVGVFCVSTYPKRGLWRLSKEQGLVAVFWAKWDPIRAKWDQSGQFVWKVGRSAPESGKKNSIIWWFQGSWQHSLSHHDSIGNSCLSYNQRLESKAVLVNKLCIYTFCPEIYLLLLWNQFYKCVKMPVHCKTLISKPYTLNPKP